MMKTVKIVLGGRLAKQAPWLAVETHVLMNEAARLLGTSLSTAEYNSTTAAKILKQGRKVLKKN